MLPLLGINTSLHPAPATNSPEKIKGAAQQFEALMITELLKTAREAGSGSGWMGTGDEDEAGQTSLDMAEQQLATVMAKAGGLGMQNLIAKGLGQKP
jgi:Rod binding domain-containing protein